MALTYTRDVSQVLGLAATTATALDADDGLTTKVSVISTLGKVYDVHKVGALYLWKDPDSPTKWRVHTACPDEPTGSGDILD